MAAPYEMFDTNGRFACIPSASSFKNGSNNAGLCQSIPGTGELMASAYIDMLKCMKEE